MSDMEDDKPKKKQVKTNVLTEEQKKAHHIASEQKRRENIRSEFDRIVELTPTLTNQENRSELNILRKSADYIDYLKDENVNLVKICQQKGITVPDDLIYKGPGIKNSTQEEIEFQNLRERNFNSKEFDIKLE